MKKILFIIKAILFNLINIPMFLVASAKTLNKCRKGEGAIYKEVRWFTDNGKVTFWQMVNLFSIQHKALAFNTNRGPTLMIHGGEKGQVFAGEKEYKNIAEYCDEAGIIGTWNLISCFNRQHQNGQKTTFIKDSNINQNHSIFGLVAFGTIYCASGRYVDTYVNTSVLLAQLFGLLEQKDK